MRYGRLDRRITLQRRTGAYTSSGQPVDTWADLASRWASVAPASGREGFSAPQIVATQQVEIQVRYSSQVADLHPGDRIVHPSGSAAALAVYDIIAVHELGRREGLRIIAERRPDELAPVAGSAADAWGGSWGSAWGVAWGTLN